MNVEERTGGDSQPVTKTPELGYTPRSEEERAFVEAFADLKCLGCEECVGDCAAMK